MAKKIRMSACRREVVVRYFPPTSAQQAGDRAHSIYTHKTQGYTTQRHIQNNSRMTNKLISILIVEHRSRAHTNNNQQNIPQAAHIHICSHIPIYIHDIKTEFVYLQNFFFSVGQRKAHTHVHMRNVKIRSLKRINIYFSLCATTSYQ